MVDSKLSTSNNQQLTSSEDEATDCMPKILTTISLQGCSDVTFKDEPEEEDLGLLYPECKIKEEKPSEDNDKKPENLLDKSLHGDPKEKEEEKMKKRIKLKQVSAVKQEKGSKSKPSTSRHNNSYEVVDARRIDLQERLFKTKELFDTFLRVCQDHGNSEEMQRAVMKLTRAYNNTKQEYLGSLRCQNLLETETEKVNTLNTKPWFNLSCVLIELNHEKVMDDPVDSTTADVPCCATVLQEADDEIVMADDEIFIADDEIVMADDKIVMANNEIVIADDEIVIADNEIVMAYNELVSDVLADIDEKEGDESGCSSEPAAAHTVNTDTALNAFATAITWAEENGVAASDIYTLKRLQENVLKVSSNAKKPKKH